MTLNLASNALQNLPKREGEIKITVGVYNETEKTFIKIVVQDNVPNYKQLKAI